MTKAANKTVAELLEITEIKRLLNPADNSKEYYEGLVDALEIIDYRRSFAKLSLVKIIVEHDQIPRFPLRNKGTQFIMVKSPTQTFSDEARDRWIVPPELQIVNGVSSDLGYGDAATPIRGVQLLEGQSVSMERLWLSLCREAQYLNESKLRMIAPTVTGDFEHDLRAALTYKDKLAPRFGREHLTKAFISADMVKQALDLKPEPTGHGLQDYGDLGTVYLDGRPIRLLTDQGRDPEHMVLSEKTLLLVGNPLYHGAYSERPVRVLEHDGETVISRSVAMSITDCTSVAWLKPE